MMKPTEAVEKAATTAWSRTIRATGKAPNTVTPAGKVCMVEACCTHGVCYTNATIVTMRLVQLRLCSLILLYLLLMLTRAVPRLAAFC